MKHPPVIETERLILRPFSLEDSTFVKENAGSEEVYRNTMGMPHPYLEENAVEWISGHPLKFYQGKGLELAITLKSGELMGVVGISVSKAHNRGELGYWLGKPYWNMGYCSEAATALVEYAFEEMGLHKITSRHFLHNPASGRVLEKTGFAKEGLLRDEYLKDRSYLSVAVYGLLKTDYSGMA
ncbi:MAG: GNAT family N-acetyltransferase [Candidatus Sabulitectum sp.]|nr:GNAT family N-acetyltransferase [Candidatus Sabulitectum sp.]